MKFVVISSLVASALAAVSTVTDVASTTVAASAEIVSVYTNAGGEKTSTTITTLPFTKAIAAYGTTASNLVIVTTIGPSKAATTITTTTGTHKYGRFDKTAASSKSSTTGTHKYGRFDKTAASSKSSSTGTHKYGRFDKTDAGTQTVVAKDTTATSSNFAGQQKINSFGLGAAALVGALIAC